MLTVSDFFCGCGGLSQGFKEAGFKIKTGIDFNKSFLETYAYNFPEAFWVKFKLFGLMGITILFVIFQSIWLSITMKNNESYNK